MSIALVKRARRRAFTLLEITLAVAILGMMSLTIYRFVASNIKIMRISSEESMAEAQYAGLINLVTTQLQGLPSGAGALSGEPFKFNERSQDEISWICGGGPGLLTRYAPGEFIVSMRLRPSSDKSAKGDKGEKMEIGFLRKPRATAEGETEGTSWVPLLDDARSLEIRYFDPAKNDWVERWPDPNSLPRLVKLVIGRPDRPEPSEAVIALARTPLPIAPPQVFQPPPQAQPPGVQPQPGGQPQPPAPGSGPKQPQAQPKPK